MGVWRKWIFPIIRILIFAAIAVALVKVAFFAEPTEAEEPAFPTGTIVEPQVPVMLGTIQNDVMLQGTVAADEAVDVKATAPGVVRKVHVAPGASVAAGAELFVIRETVMREDGTSWLRDIKVATPGAGVLSAVSVIEGQTVAVGDVIGKVAPPSFHITATLLPEQQYRLLNQPTEALITIAGGPAPFACTGLTISTALAGAEDGSSGGTSLRCAVPADVRVFAGLAAEVTIAGGKAENVLVAPITAVEGTSESGNVHFVLPDGSTELRAVVLGLNDGINVELKEGVAEGETILQFIPGAAEVVGDFPGGMPIGEVCTQLPDGGMMCESVGG